MRLHFREQQCEPTSTLPPSNLTLVIIDVTWFPIPFPLAAPSQASPGERHHVHFVGPLPFQTTDQVFTTLCRNFLDSLKRLPDGETGHRQGPPHWQTEVFQQAGLSHYLKNGGLLQSAALDDVLPGVLIDPALELDTRWALLYKSFQCVVDSFAFRYGHYAIASYQTFSKHKAAGIIPSNVKFQVSLPLPKTFVAVWIKPEYQDQVEPQYEAAIIRAIETIQNATPHQELAIQIDCVLTSRDLGHAAPLIADCAARLAQHVSADVDLGFHLATSLTGRLKDMVGIAKAIRRQCSRSNSWLHLSIPSETTDQHFRLALEDLASDESLTKTELVLGLVQPRDGEGSRRRLRRAVDRLRSTDFGISAACNLADLTQQDFEDVLRILKKLSTPGG